MKVNGRHLANCLGVDQSRLKSGYLYKKSESSRGFQKRWIVIRDNVLFYFQKKSDPIPVGFVVLEGYSVQLIDKLSFQVDFPGSGSRTYVFLAETEEDVKGWMEAIIGAGFDYLKYAIMELEKQVDELNRLEKDKVENSLSTDRNQLGDIAAGLAESASYSEKGRFLEKTEQAAVNPVERNHLDGGKDTDIRSYRTFLDMHRKFERNIEKNTGK